MNLKKMQFKSLFNSVIRRQFSSANLINVKVHEKSGVSTVSMNRPPVNGLNLDLLNELLITLNKLETDKCRGLILSSDLPSVYSGGLDIMEMYKPNVERVKQFWTTLQDVWLKLYGAPYPTVAAISGHAPAGGCLLALSCEYRIMLPNYSIGLNETQLGIVAPAWFQTTMLNVLDRRTAEFALTTGRMFSTDEALKSGLIDEIANNNQDMVTKSEKFLKRFRKIAPQAHSLTKLSFRSQDLATLRNNRKQDLDIFLSVIMQPKVQKGLEMYLESLKKKS